MGVKGESLTNEKRHRVALVTGVLDLGGTTTFCNLAGELIRRALKAKVFSFSRIIRWRAILPGSRFRCSPRANGG